MGGRKYRMRTIAAIIVASIVTLVVAALGVVSPSDVVDLADEQATTTPATTNQPDLHVRALPLVVAGGGMEQLPVDRQLTEADGVAALDLALRRTGLRALWPRLVAAAEADLARLQNHSAPHYPYRYVASEQVLRAVVPANTAMSINPNAWVDLASILTVNAARATSDQFATDASAVLAYSILAHARQAQNTCNIQLQFAHVVSLGMNSHWTGTASEFRSAHALCGSDATPLMALGTWQLSTLYPSLGGVWAYPGDDAAIEAAGQTFTELERAHRTLPLGLAGLGLIALRKADRHLEEGQRFSARNAYRTAQEHYAAARGRSADPLLGVGAARAELGLGKPARALALLDETLERAPGTNQAIVLTSEALHAAGRWKDLADHSLTYSSATVINGTHLSRRGGWSPLPLVEFPGFSTTLKAQVNDATYNAVGGGDTLDFGFIPEHRRVGTLDATHGTSVRLEALFMAEEWNSFNQTASPASAGPALDIYGVQQYEPRSLIDAGQDEQRNPVNQPESQLRERFEDRQDLWRSGRLWSQAERANREWVEAVPHDGYAWDRLGEVQFLQGKNLLALDSFLKSRYLLSTNPSLESPRMSMLGGHSPQEASALALVKAGAALEEMGLHGVARPLYARALEEGQALDPDRDAVHYAASQLGLLALREGRHDDAIMALQTGIASSKSEDEFWPKDRVPRLLKGAQENNLALAMALDGSSPEAVAVARDAVSRDPANPIFLETLAYAHQSRGDASGAIRTYEEALSQDRSNYVARNNLGVLLAEANQTAQAREHFREALATRADYGPAWFNLGVLDAREPVAFLRSQAALARAAQVDRRLLGARPQLMIDHEIYDTGFDVSRALPPDWGFGETSRAIPFGLGLLVLGVIIARLIWVLTTDHIGERFASLVTALSRKPGWRGRLAIPWPVSLSILATAALAALAAWHQGRLGLEVAVVAGFSLAIAGSMALLRSGSYAWAPSIGAGVVLAPFGIAFAPVPCAYRTGMRQSWSPIILLSAVTALLVVATLLTPVPVTRLAAIAAIAMLASALLPVPPHDGALLPNKRWDYAATGILTVLGAGLALDWI